MIDRSLNHDLSHFISASPIEKNCMTSIRKRRAEFIVTVLHAIFLTPHVIHEVAIGELNPSCIISLDGILELLGTITAISTVIVFFFYKYYEKSYEKVP